MQSNADIQTNRERTVRKIIDYLSELDFLNKPHEWRSFPVSWECFPRLSGKNRHRDSLRIFDTFDEKYNRSYNYPCTSVVVTTLVRSYDFIAFYYLTKPNKDLTTLENLRIDFIRKNGKTSYK